VSVNKWIELLEKLVTNLSPKPVDFELLWTAQEPEK
jgi:hypothetical protein